MDDAVNAYETLMRCNKLLIYIFVCFVCWLVSKQILGFDPLNIKDDTVQPIYQYMKNICL